jgi:hypothetical protein
MHELPTIAPTKERHPSPFESFLERELPKQYEEQARLLEDLGFLQILPESKQYGIVDKEQNEYPFPEYEDIKREILKDKEAFETKFNQGFTELRITPFALPTKTLFTAIEQEIRIQHKKGILHSTDGTTLDLDLNQPLYQWDGYENQEPVYFPENFDQTNHNGKTKQQILDSKTSTFPGFLVSFEESSQDIPRDGQGTEINGRPQLEAGKSAQEYLKLLKTDPYQHESGLTVEDWAIRFLSALHKDGTVLYDWDAKDTNGEENASGCINLATFFPKGGVVSNAHWVRVGRRAFVDGRGAGFGNSSYGAGSSVRVGSL